MDAASENPGAILQRVGEQARERVMQFSPSLHLQPAHAVPVPTLPNGDGRSHVVLGSQLGLELGGPAAPSVALVAWSEVAHLDAVDTILTWPEHVDTDPGHPRSLAIAVLLTVEPGTVPRPGCVARLRLPGNDWSGCMARRLLGRPWLRLDQRILGNHLVPTGLARSLVECARSGIPELRSVLAVVAVDRTDVVDALSPLAEQARDAERLLWPPVDVKDNAAPCGASDCRTCDDRKVCDAFRV